MFQCVDKERHADLPKLSSNENMNEKKGNGSRIISIAKIHYQEMS
jgi:hypothetical protein